MASAPKPLTLVSTEPATLLERLHADRAGLTGELTVLNASSARLHAAANAEAAVLQEIADMGSADIAAMTAWASAGCIGEAPRSDQNKRIKLGQALNAAQAAAAAAKGAGEDIIQQIRELHERLAIINSQIQIATFDAMQVEWTHIHEQHRIAVELTRVLTAKLTGLHGYFAAEGRKATDIRRDYEAGRVYSSRAEGLSRVKLTEQGLTISEMHEGVAFWSKRAAALGEGSAS